MSVLEITSIEEIFQKRQAIIKYDLVRIKEAYKILALDQRNVPTITIGGTNGKGSVSGFLWHLFAAVDISSGLFISPHVCKFLERIQCSKKFVTDEQILESLSYIKKKLPNDLFADLSFFELTLLIGLHIFGENKTEVNILEVGLGGRLDAANIVESIASVVTSIDFDHKEYLGDTLPKIAYEKLGIARENKPLFWADERFEDKNIFEEIKKTKSTVYLVKQLVAIQSDKIVIEFHGENFHFPIKDHLKTFPKRLKTNFSVSLLVFIWFLKEQKKISTFEIQSILLDISSKVLTNKIPWPYSLLGRFTYLQILEKNSSPKFILDVCHNPAAVSSFVLSLKETWRGIGNKKPLAFICVLCDKDIKGILLAIENVFDRVVFFRSSDERSQDMTKSPYNFPSEMVFDNFSLAWQSVKTAADIDGETFVVFGSFKAVGEVLSYFKSYPEDYWFTNQLVGTDPS